MDNLLDNKLFFLIYVDFNDEISLKGPFNHEYKEKDKIIPEGKDVSLRDDVREKGYRCISHVWGTSIPMYDNNDDDSVESYSDDDVGDYVKNDDDDNNNVDDSVENDEEIKELARIRQDEWNEKKMGFIWKKGEKDDERGINYHRIDEITWNVETRIEKRERLLQIFKYHKGYFWMDNLCIDQRAKPEDKPLEIMGDIYRKCKECVCMLDTVCVVNGFTSEKELMMDIAKDVKEHSNAGKRFGSKYKEICRDNDYGFFDPNEDRSLGEHEIYLRTTRSAQWFDRVWTWQEAALPSKLLFCSEQAREYRYDPFDHEFLKELFPYKFAEMVARDIENASAVDAEIAELGWYRTGCMADMLAMLRCVQPMMQLGRKGFNIWDNIRLAADSTRFCTNKEDYVYGIMGILNLSIPKGLALDDAMVELEKDLQRQGIFIGEGSGSGVSRSGLGDLYWERRPIDGIMVLGKGDNITIEFNSDVGIVSYENHGRILYREGIDHDDEKYKHVCHMYKMESSTIFLEDDYTVGDMLEVTRIGRKECTFQGRGRKHKKNEIFEIKGNMVKIVGYIVYDDQPDDEESENEAIMLHP